MTTRKEIYNWLKVILDKTNFAGDDGRQIIELKKKLSESEIESIICSVANLFGDKLRTYHTDVDLCRDFKFRANYIPIDCKTIDIDKNGKLYVNIEQVIDNEYVLQGLIESDVFIEKLSKIIDTHDISPDLIVNKLLLSEKFITRIARIVNDIYGALHGEKAALVEDENPGENLEEPKELEEPNKPSEPEEPEEPATEEKTGSVEGFEESEEEF